MAVARNTLRVITLERLGEFFNQQSLRLRYTPRKFVIHPGEWWGCEWWGWEL